MSPIWCIHYLDYVLDHDRRKIYGLVVDQGFHEHQVYNGGNGDTLGPGQHFFDQFKVVGILVGAPS